MQPADYGTAGLSITPMQPTIPHQQIIVIGGCPACRVSFIQNSPEFFRKHLLNFTLNFVCQNQIFFLSDWIFRRAHESTWYTLWYIPFSHRADMLFDVNRKKVY